MKFAGRFRDIDPSLENYRKRSNFSVVSNKKEEYFVHSSGKEDQN
jgi:hypothetical protein